MELFKVFGSFFIKDEGSKSIEELEKKGEKAEGKLSKAFGIVGKGAAIMGGALLAAGASGLAMANKFASTADELDKSSMKMGVNTTALQELRFAMGQVGVGSDTLDQALKRTNQRLGEAAAGNEKYQDALVNLGFSLDDVMNGQLDVDDVFMKSIDTLNNMGNSQEAAALAAELFGAKTAQELMPAIEAGTLSIEELRQKTHELGAVISEDGIAAGVLWSDTMDQMKNMMGGVFNSLAVELLPVFQKFLEWIMDKMPQIQAFVSKAFDIIRTAIGIGVEAIQWLINWLKTWYNDNQETIEAIKEGFMLFFDTLVEFFESFIQLATTLWENYGEYILNHINNVWQLIKAVFQTAFDLIVDIFNVFSALFRGDWSGLWDAVKNLLTNALDNIKSMIEKAFNVVWDTVTAIFGGIKNTILDIWSGIFDGIKGYINLIINAMNKMIGGINSIGFDVPSWVPVIGGKSWGFNLPKIPAYAKGTDFHPGGMALVGEEGPELVNLPRGSSVKTAGETEETLGAKIINYITVQGNIDRDLYEDIMRRQKNDYDINLALTGVR